MFTKVSQHAVLRWGRRIERALRATIAATLGFGGCECLLALARDHGESKLWFEMFEWESQHAVLRWGRRIEERFARPPPPPSVFDRFESAFGFCEDRCG